MLQCSSFRIVPPAGDLCADGQAMNPHDPGAEYRHRLSCNPDDVVALRRVGVLYGTRGELSQARGLLERATRLAPDDAEAHAELGVTLERAGALDEAEMAYRRALHLEPRSADGWSNLAN